MSQAIVRKSFESRLETWASAQTPAIPIAWSNVNFTPPTNGGRYCRAFTLPADTQASHFDRTDRVFRGVFQVSLVLPLNKGIGQAEALAGSLDAAFASSFVQDGLRIHLLRPFSMAPGIPENDRFVIPLSAEYEAHVVP